MIFLSELVKQKQEKNCFSLGESLWVYSVLYSALQLPEIPLDFCVYVRAQVNECILNLWHEIHSYGNGVANEVEILLYVPCFT